MTSPFQIKTLLTKNCLMNDTLEKDGNQQVLCLCSITKEPPLVLHFSHQIGGKILRKEEPVGETR